MTAKQKERLLKAIFTKEDAYNGNDILSQSYEVKDGYLYASIPYAGMASRVGIKMPTDKKNGLYHWANPAFLKDKIPEQNKDFQSYKFPTSHTVKVNDLLTILTVSSSDKLRYFMCGFAITKMGTVCATDGMRMMATKSLEHEPDELEFSDATPINTGGDKKVKAFWDALLSAHKGQDMRIHVDPMDAYKPYRIEIGEVVLEFHRDNVVGFPNCKRVLPEGKEEVLSLCNGLEETFKRAKELIRSLGLNDTPILLFNKEGIHVLSKEGEEERKAYTVHHTNFMRENAASLVLNCTYIAGAYLAGGRVFTRDKEYGGLRSNDGNFINVVMPMQLDNEYNGDANDGLTYINSFEDYDISPTTSALLKTFGKGPCFVVDKEGIQASITVSSENDRVSSRNIIYLQEADKTLWHNLEQGLYRCATLPTLSKTGAIPKGGYIESDMRIGAKVTHTLDGQKFLKAAQYVQGGQYPYVIIRKDGTFTALNWTILTESLDPIESWDDVLRVPVNRTFMRFYKELFKNTVQFGTHPEYGYFLTNGSLYVTFGKPEVEYSKTLESVCNFYDTHVKGGKTALSFDSIAEFEEMASLAVKAMDEGKHHYSGEENIRIEFTPNGVYVRPMYGDDVVKVSSKVFTSKGPDVVSSYIGRFRDLLAFSLSISGTDKGLVTEQIDGWYRILVA